MNVSIARMRPTVKVLRGIEAQLKRIADALELYLTHEHNLYLHAPKIDTGGDEPEALYTDEEADIVREIKRVTEGRAKEE